MLIELYDRIVYVENSDIKMFGRYEQNKREHLGHLLTSSGSPANLDPIIKATKVKMNAIARQFYAIPW